MKCNRLKKYLIPYAEGVLPDRLIEPVEEHLSSCNACAQEIDELAGMVEVLKHTDYPAMEPAFDLRSRVMAQIVREPVRKPWWSGRLQAYSAVAAALLFIVIAITAVEHNLSQTGPIATVPPGGGKMEAESPSSPGIAGSPRMQGGVVGKSAREPAMAGIPGAGKMEVPSIVARSAQEARLAKSKVTMPSFERVMPGAQSRARAERPHSAFGVKEYDASPSVLGERKGAGTLSQGVKDATIPRARTYSKGEQSPVLRDSADSASPPTSETVMAEQARPAPQSLHGGGPEKGLASGGRADDQAAAFGAVPGPAGPVLKAGEPLAKTQAARAKDDGAPARDVRHDAMGGRKAGDEVLVLEKKLRDFPTSRMVLTQLAGAYREAGRTEDEFAVTERLTKLDSGNAQYWFMLGQSAERIKRPSTAIDAYHRSIGLKLTEPNLDLAKSRLQALEGDGK